MKIFGIWKQHSLILGNFWPNLGVFEDHLWSFTIAGNRQIHKKLCKWVEQNYVDYVSYP